MILKNFWSPPLALKNRRCLPAKPSGIGIVGLGDIVIIGKPLIPFITVISTHPAPVQ